MTFTWWKDRQTGDLSWTSLKGYDLFLRLLTFRPEILRKLDVKVKTPEGKIHCHEVYFAQGCSPMKLNGPSLIVALRYSDVFTTPSVFALASSQPSSRRGESVARADDCSRERDGARDHVVTLLRRVVSY